MTGFGAKIAISLRVKFPLYLILALFCAKALSGARHSLCTDAYRKTGGLNFFTQEQYVRLATDETGMLLVPGGHILSFPQAIQPNNADCGVTSVQTSLAFFGKSHSHKSLKQLLGTDPEIGTDLKQIVKVLKSLGLEPRASFKTTNRKTEKSWGKKFTVKEIESAIDKKHPVIVLFQAYAPEGYATEKESGHYAVVIGYDKENLYFMDPNNHGTLKYLPKSDFLKRWHALDNETELLEGVGVVVSSKTESDYSHGLNRATFSNVPLIRNHPSPGAAVAYSLIDYFKLDYYQDDVQTFFEKSGSLEQTLDHYKIKFSRVAPSQRDPNKLTVLQDAKTNWYGILIGKQGADFIVMDPANADHYQLMKPSDVNRLLQNQDTVLQIESKRPRNLRFDEVSYLD